MVNATQEINIIIPAIDGVPLMAPPIVEKVLLIFTFVLHLLPMSVMLGSTLMAILLKSQHLLGYGEHKMAYGLYRSILKILPTCLSLTITFGVAPLLFLQALYAPLFYTSTILMAPFWLLILAFIMSSYYIFYLLGWTGEKVLRPLRLPLLIAACAGIFYAAFMYGANNSLMQAPEKFRAIYNSTFYGLYIYASDPEIYLRFLHTIFGSIMVASVALFAIFGRGGNAAAPESAYAAAYLKPAFLGALAMQFIIGLAMLFTQRPEVFAALTGANPFMTGIFWAGVLAAIGQAFFARGRYPALLSRTRVASLAALTITTLSLMAITRDFIRDAAIGRAFSYMNNPYDWNFGVLGAFFVTLAAGLAVVAYMLFGLKETASAKPK